MPFANALIPIINNSRASLNGFWQVRSLPKRFFLARHRERLTVPGNPFTRYPLLQGCILVIAVSYVAVTC